MRSRSRWFGAVAVALSTVALLGLAERSDAATITWDVQGGDPNTCKTISTNTACPGGGSGGTGAPNIRTFTDGPHILKAAAFSAVNQTTNFSRAWLGLYPGNSFGLGVTNSVEPEPGGAPAHTVDNFGSKDMIVFQFPTTGWVPLSTFLNSNGTWGGDTDISVWVGGNSIADLSSPAWTTLKYNTLNSNGFTQYTAAGADLTGGNSGRNAQLNKDPIGPAAAANLTGKFLIIAADILSTNDRFKIKSLTGQTPSASVPEPVASALFGAGLVALGLLKRRAH
jgi:hypothetical protein